MSRAAQAHMRGRGPGGPGRVGLACALAVVLIARAAAADEPPRPPPPPRAGAPMPAAATVGGTPPPASPAPAPGSPSPSAPAAELPPAAPPPAAGPTPSAPATTAPAPGTSTPAVVAPPAPSVAGASVAAPSVAAPAAGKPAGAPPPAAPAPAASASAGTPGVDEAFELKVKALEENVNELKEKIFRTKARLLLLQETVLGGDITAGAKAVLIHRNEMGSQFVLESVSYALDGAPIFTRVDADGDLDKKQEIEIFNGRIVPGNHAISVKLQYRGHGYGVFSYLEGYKFKVQSGYTFNAEGGKVTLIKIVGYEKGNITTDLKDRPAVKYDVEVTRDTVKRASAQADAPATEAGAKPQ